MKNKTLVITAAAGVAFLALGWSLYKQDHNAIVMALDVSSDGRYAISSHLDNRVVLWDLEERTQRAIARNANIYIAQFTQQDDAMVWQGLDNVVQVMALDGTQQHQFEHPPAYSLAAMSAQGPFVMSGYRWDIALHSPSGDCQIKPESGSVAGLGKPLNVIMSNQEGIVLTAGDGAVYQSSDTFFEEQRRHGFKRLIGVTLWDTTTCEPLFNFPGNSAKTHATLSPDGRFAVSVDENRLSYIWSTDTGERAYIIGTSFSFGQFIGGYDVSDPANWNNDGAHLQYPADFPKGFHGQSMVAVQFISDTDYLTFHNNQPYSVLWKLGDPFAHAIVPLGEDPFPSVNAYARNASIATAPQAHRLVTGQRDGGGINVYDFDPNTQTLTPVWTPRRHSFWWPF